MHAVKRPPLFGLFKRSMDESDILNDAHLDDELEVDDGWAADSDSRDSGEQKVEEDADAEDDEGAGEEDDADEGAEG